MREIEPGDPDYCEADYRALSIADLLAGRAIIVEDGRLALARAPFWRKAMAVVVDIYRGQYEARFFTGSIGEEYNRPADARVLLSLVHHWPIRDQSSGGRIVTLFDSHGEGCNFDLGIYRKKNGLGRKYLREHSWSGQVQIFWYLGHFARLDTLYLTKVYGDKVPLRQEVPSAVGSQVPARIFVPQP